MTALRAFCLRGSDFILVSLHDVSQLQLSARQSENGHSVSVRWDDTTIGPPEDGAPVNTQVLGQFVDTIILDPFFELDRRHIGSRPDGNVCQRVAQEETFLKK